MGMVTEEIFKSKLPADMSEEMKQTLWNDFNTFGESFYVHNAEGPYIRISPTQVEAAFKEKKMKIETVGKI